MPRSFIISNLNNAICHLCGRVRLEAYQTKSERPSIDGFMGEQTNYAPRTFFCSPVFSINNQYFSSAFVVTLNPYLLFHQYPLHCCKEGIRGKMGLNGLNSQLSFFPRPCPRPGGTGNKLVRNKNRMKVTISPPIR